MMDPVEALRHVRTLLKVALESGDLDAMEKHVAMAQTIIDKALPSARTAARHAKEFRRRADQGLQATQSMKSASPLDKILDEPRIGLGNDLGIKKPAKGGNG
jgi:hypothetical protein